MSFGFCFYRLPSDSRIWKVSGEVNASRVSPNSEEGFVFAPFDGENSWAIAGKPMQLDSLVNHNIESIFCDDIFIERRDDELKRIDSFINLVKEGKLKKIVAARTKWIPQPLRNDVFNLFHQLCNAYPNAFVYLWSAVATGTWMGATPEMLMRQSGEFAQTVALAGTKRVASAEGFEHKEIAEQHWVLKFLLESLEEQGCSHIKSGELQERNAGHLIHLSTLVEFKLKDIQGRWDLIKSLHPTPAVAGYPKRDSVEFIHHLEPFSRKYYSGYLGPFNPQRADIFVNLRCLQWFVNGVQLYAGAGITDESVAENEWYEMEEKMDTLARWL